MNYATIKNCDIANGPGVRVSLFVLRLHPPLQRLLQSGGLGFSLRKALHPRDH